MAEEDIDISTEETIEKAYDTKLMKRLIKYTKPYYKYFFAAIILLLLNTLADLASPYLVKIAIDDYIIKTQNGSAVVKLGLLYILLIIVAFLLNYGQIFVLTQAGQRIVYSLRQELFNHIQRLPLKVFDTTPVGKLVTRITNDTETLNDMYTNVLVTLLKDISMIIGIIIILFSMNLKLAGIVLLVLPIILIITAIFRIKVRDVYRRIRVSVSKINTVLSENLSGIRIIQIFNREKPNYREFKKVNDEFYKAGVSEVVVYGVFRPIINMLSFFAIALIIFFGGSKVLDSTITFGVLYAFINYISMLFQPINDLAEKYNILQSSMAASERIFAILDMEEETDEGSKLSNEEIHGEVEFKNVWFAYNNEDYVLKDVSFKVPAGKTVAIVGATGAGKTSIISLINRLYNINKGSILIDGRELPTISLESLRGAVGMVLQDVFLFSGDIAKNIHLNDTSMSNDYINQVANYVNASSFIEKLPSKYSEEVKEGGATLSTGQRQLLAFARALAFDPKILILDEATANIDTETEYLIQDALSKLTKNRTTIIIAHRLSTIQHADNIIVMHKGKIREMGTHNDLLSMKGLYYNLYKLQYKES